MRLILCLLQYVCYKFGFAKVKLVLTKFQQTSQRNRKGSILWRFLCHPHVCTAILFSLCSYNPFYYAQLRFFFLCLNIDDKHFGDKHIFGGLGKVCLFF